VAELKKKIHALKPALYPARQRLTLPAKPGAKSGELLKDSATIASAGLSDGSVVVFKDLGTQVRPRQGNGRSRIAAAGRLQRSARVGRASVCAATITAVSAAAVAA
jgi:hypothetical protein